MTKPAAKDLTFSTKQDFIEYYRSAYPALINSAYTYGGEINHKQLVPHYLKLFEQVTGLWAKAVRTPEQLLSPEMFTFVLGAHYCLQEVEKGLKAAGQRVPEAYKPAQAELRSLKNRLYVGQKDARLALTSGLPVTQELRQDTLLASIQSLQENEDTMDIVFAEKTAKACYADMRYLDDAWRWIDLADTEKLSDAVTYLSATFAALSTHYGKSDNPERYEARQLRLLGKLFLQLFKFSYFPLTNLEADTVPSYVAQAIKQVATAVDALSSKKRTALSEQLKTMFNSIVSAGPKEQSFSAENIQTIKTAWRNIVSEISKISSDLVANTAFTKFLLLVGSHVAAVEVPVKKVSAPLSLSDMPAFPSPIQRKVQNGHNTSVESKPLETSEELLAAIDSITAESSMSKTDLKPKSPLRRTRFPSLRGLPGMSRRRSSSMSRENQKNSKMDPKSTASQPPLPRLDLKGNSESADLNEVLAFINNASGT